MWTRGWVADPEDSVASTLAGRLLTALEGADTQPPSTPQVTLELIEAGIWRRSPTPVALVLDDTAPDPARLPRCPAAHRVGGPATGPPGICCSPAARHCPYPPPDWPPWDRPCNWAKRTWLSSLLELAEFAALRDVAPAVLQHNGGWPALMELTASIGDHRAVEFLQEELLGRLPTEHRRFLAAFAVVGGGDQQVADALTDTPVDLDGLLAGLPLVAGTPGRAALTARIVDACPDPRAVRD